MSHHLRLCLFAPAGLVFSAGLLWGLHGLPAFGNYLGPYGKVINAVAVSERHLTNMATGVNFDYRAFDTLGEEYILFAAVTALALLLRQARGEIEDEPREYSADRRVLRSADDPHWLGLLLIGATVVFGIYVVSHAHLTPGGGFQGGVILGTACLLAYLAVGYREFKVVSPKEMLELAEAAGAGGYALIGLATMLAGGTFLINALPLGQVGNLLSAGVVPVINLAVGVEVAGGFILVFTEFLKDTRKPSESKGP
jgi:multicomponent Na+:H+ antiporter subunit B